MKCFATSGTVYLLTVFQVVVSLADKQPVAPGGKRCLALLLLLMLTGCGEGTTNTPSAPATSGSGKVVAYVALDGEFSRAILDDFAATSGIETRPKFDTEAAKSVGLTQEIMRSEGAQRCDVFWNNEILNTLRLRRRGLLVPYDSPAAAPFPDFAKADDHTWHAFAARARVLIVNTDLVPEADRPGSIFDLTEPKWRGRAVIAKPLFGTTATHAACLFAALGPEMAKQFFLDLKANDVTILAGNKQVALEVAAGNAAVGFTDTDDAIIEVNAGKPVAIVYPDQADGQLGTLFIPNTVAIIKDGPNPEAAGKLVDYLLTPEVEGRLALARSAQIPLNPEVTEKPPVETPQTIRAMDIDFDAALDHWDGTREFIIDQFTTP